MGDYILDIDSGDRNTNLFPDVSNLEIYLENEIYDVSKITLISGNIPTPQLTICETNKQFDVNGTTITLDEKNYTDGTTLASDLKTALSATPVSNVIYSSNTNSLTFTGSSAFTFKFKSGTNGSDINNALTTPHEVLGFSASDVSSSANTIESGAINLSGPNAVLLRFTCGSDVYSKDIYYNNPHYTGKIHLQQGESSKFINSDDLVEYDFNSGVQSTLQNLRLEFFYSSGGKLVPYDFRNSNYSLKFKIKCSREKIISKVKRDVSLPPPISIPEFDDVDRWDWHKYKVYLAIAIIVIFGIFAIYVTRPKTPLSE